MGNIQIPEKYRDEKRRLDENQLADDIGLYLSDLEEDESSFDQVLNGIVTEVMKRIQYPKDGEEPLFTDERNELYGYGIFNVHEHELTELCGDKEEAVQRFRRVSENLSSNSHLRVVEVRLSNQLDKKASEAVKQ